MKNIYEINYYTKSDCKAYCHVYAETSAEAIAIAKQNRDFDALMGYSIIDIYSFKYTYRYDAQYVNKILGQQELYENFRTIYNYQFW